MSNKSPTPAASKPLTWLSFGVMLLNAAGLLIVGPVVGVLNHFLRDTFADQHMQLPMVTRFFLDTSWWLWCIVFLPPAVAVFVLEFKVRNKAATMTINIVIGGLMLVFLAAYVLAMMVPMFLMMAQRSA